MYDADLIEMKKKLDVVLAPRTKEYQLGYKQGRADAIEEFVKFIDKHTHEVGGEICLDDDITILAEQLKENN